MPKLSMLDMVSNAIKELNTRGGSSLQAIKKYCASNYGLDYTKGGDKSRMLNTLFTHSKPGGKLVKNKGSYKMGKIPKKKKPAKKKTPKKKKSGGGGGGLQQPRDLSAELADICGSARLSRSQVVKQLWVYIKKHDLQDPDDKRQILCDAKLQKLFNRNSVSMFGMQSLLTPHIM
jgi:chromatin remodeling complex protein RSC6